MNWRVVLILSLGLNVLFAALAWKARSRPDPEAGPASASAEPVAVEPVVRVITNEVVLRQSAPAPELVWPTWNELASADWGEFRTNLLAVGCPSETVRDILLAALRRERYAERRPILASVNPIFWDEIARHNFEPKTGPLKQALEQLEALDQKHNVLEQAVLAGLSYGNEAEEHLRKRKGLEDQFSHLEPAIHQQAMALHDAHSLKHQELITKHLDERGRVTEDGIKKLEELGAELQTRLKELMGPEAAREWELRTSSKSTWAASLRGLEASPEEMRQVAGWMAEYADYLKSLPADEVVVDERFLARYGLPQPDVSPATNAEAEVLENRIRELLGEERYAVMQQANDQNYVQLYDLAERFELPPQVVSQGLQMQRDAQAAGEQIRANADLTAAQRRDALRAIQQETRQAVEGLLGADAFYTYQRHGGDWINGLSALNAGR